MKYKRTKKLVRKYIDKWITPLGLRWWHIDVHYVRDKKTIQKYFSNEDEGKVTFARVFSDWQYLKASVYVNVREAAGQTEEEIEDMILHELCHLLVNEMREPGLKHEERVVTGLQRAFKWTREADR